MDTTLHAQSVADLGRTLIETIDRVGQTGRAEIVTVDGQPRVVLLSVSAYQELAQDPLTDDDVRTMRLSIEQIGRGEFKEAGAFFDELHAELLALESSTPKDVA